MAATTKVLRLADVRDPVAGRIELPGGTQHVVRQATGEQYQALAGFTAQTAIMEFYHVVRGVVPSLSEAELLALDREQCTAVITLSTQGVAAVEAMFPNAVSPEPSTPPG